MLQDDDNTENPWGIDKEKHKNWLKSVYGLKCLKKYLDAFADREADVFHRLLKVKLGRKKCTNNCTFKGWKPRANQLPPLDCEVCAAWRDQIWDKHICQRGRVYWMNCTPCLWSKDKWEVAKVYMPDGHKKHKSVCDFDIVAFLLFMTQCQHFEEFGLKPFCEKVVYVRNEVMHSPNFELEQEKLHLYLKHIKNLGEKLEEDFSEFGKLSEDIDGIQNLDFTLNFPMSLEAEAAMGDSDKCSTMDLLNTLRGIMTDEDIENLLLAAVQKSRLPGRKRASLRREERLPQPQRQDEDLHCAAAAAAAQETVDHTMDSFKINMTKLTKRIAEVTNRKNMHWRAEEAHHSQESSSRKLAVPQQKTSKADDKLIDFFAKTYAIGESFCKALDSDEEDEEESKEEEPEMEKLPHMYSMLVASVMAVAKTIVDEDS